MAAAALQATSRKQPDLRGVTKRIRQAAQWTDSLELLREATAGTSCPDVVAVGAAITACSKALEWRAAAQLMFHLDTEQLQPNGFVYSAAIRACGLPEAWSHSLELLRDMLQRRLEPDAICYSAVASACVKCSSWAPALSLLCAAIAHQGLGLVLANAMLGALEMPGLWESSSCLLEEMQASFVLPDVISYSVAISACERAAEWCTALELLRSMEQQSVSSNIIACTSVISACASGGAWQQALWLFAALPGRSLSANLVTYGATISACARAVHWQRAMTLTEQFFEGPPMQQASSTMLNAVIYACARGAEWRPALAWLRQMAEQELQPDVISFNSCIFAFEDVLSEDDARFGIVRELVDEKLALGSTGPRRLRRKPYASNDFFQLIKPLVAEGLRGLSLRRFLRACARPLQRSFRASRLKATSSLLVRLGDDGWEVSPLPWLADGFLAQGATAVGGSPPHVTGEVSQTFQAASDIGKIEIRYFQEATSMLPAEVLLRALECFMQTSGRRTMTGLLLLDLCAAPGSKSTQLAAGLQGGGALLANEPDFRRAEILHRNLLRSGSGSQVVSCADGREVGQVFPEAFDGVLVDAPCSCEGTVRKEILRLLRCDAKESQALTEIQLSLLHSGWRALKPGGCLVYSTCTFNPSENEELCSQFLMDVGRVCAADAACIFIPDASIVMMLMVLNAAVPVEILSLLELPSAVGSHFRVLSKGGGGLGAVRLLPHSFNVEGFFICCFRKSADHPTAAGAALRTSEFASARFRRRPNQVATAVQALTRAFRREGIRNRVSVTICNRREDKPLTAASLEAACVIDDGWEICQGYLSRGSAHRVIWYDLLYRLRRGEELPRGLTWAKAWRTIIEESRVWNPPQRPRLGGPFAPRSRGKRRHRRGSSAAEVGDEAGQDDEQLLGRVLSLELSSGSVVEGLVDVPELLQVLVVLPAVLVTKRTFATELSARRAGTSELVPRQPVSMEVVSSEDALMLPQGEPRVLGPRIEVPSQAEQTTMSFYRQGDHTQHNTTYHLEQHDQRSVDGVEVHQQILNQVDQRQVHVHQVSDHAVVLEAARHVVAPNQKVSTAEAQALQAVVQARGEAEAMVNETRSQAQILSVRFAAELELAQQREQKLKEHVEGLRRELDRRDAANALTAVSGRLGKLEEEFAALRDIVQELWINQESWNEWTPPEAPPQASDTPQHAQSSSPVRVHRL
eukprot:s1560_g15.t9